MPINWNLPETKIKFELKNIYSALSVALTYLNQSINNLQNLQDHLCIPNNIRAFIEYIKAAKDFETLINEKIQPIIIDFTLIISKLEKLKRKFDIKIEDLKYAYCLETMQQISPELYWDSFNHYFLDILKITQRKTEVILQLKGIQEDLDDTISLKSETLDHLIMITNIILKDEKTKDIIFKSLDKETFNWFENWIEKCPFINHPIYQEYEHNKEFLARSHTI